MQLMVNGEPMELPEPCSVAELLQRHGLPPVRVAVERNGAIVPRKTFEAVLLSAGDRIEIVTFVGGG